MKKVLIISSILAVLVITAFFFGWISLSLQAGTAALVYTKAQGFESKVLAEGKFHYRFQALLPYNLKIYFYPLAPRFLSTTVSGELPSAQALSSLSEYPDKMAFSLDVAVSYAPNPDYLPSLAKEKNVLPDQLDAYLTSLEPGILSMIGQTVLAYYSEESSFLPDAARIASQAKAALLDKMPEISVLSLDISKVSLPDKAAYAILRTAYLELLTKKTVSVSAQKDSLYATDNMLESKLKVLESYGKLFKEYPSLLDYLKITAETGIDLTEIIRRN